MEALCLYSSSPSSVEKVQLGHETTAHVLRCARTLYVTHCTRGASESKRHRGFWQYCIRDVRVPEMPATANNHGPGVIGGWPP
jgi:hypothetical protein